MFGILPTQWFIEGLLPFGAQANFRGTISPILRARAGAAMRGLERAVGFQILILLISFGRTLHLGQHEEDPKNMILSSVEQT